MQECIYFFHRNDVVFDPLYVMSRSIHPRLVIGFLVLLFLASLGAYFAIQFETVVEKRTPLPAGPRKFQ
jgi:hypothetical protein